MLKRGTSIWRILPLLIVISWVAVFMGMQAISPEAGRWFSRHWYFSAPFFLGASVWAVLKARRVDARTPMGHCHACAYDLRGQAAGGTCPECGAGFRLP